MKRVIAVPLLLFVSVVSGRAQPGLWLTRASLPTPRQEISHAVLNGGAIFVPGGLAAGGVGSAVVEAFEPRMNSWTLGQVASLPEALHHLGVVAAGGKLYVLGGYTGSSFTPMNRTYVYLPDSNVWRARANMLVARGAHAAVEFGGKIYLFGGITSDNNSRRADVYDPKINVWRNLANMPTSREHLAAAAIDSLIYVVGGRLGAANTNALEAYSPQTNTWYTKAPMPTARGGLAAAAMRGRLYVFGGEIPGVFPQNEEYNPVTNTWRTMAPMRTPRHGIGAVTVGDSIFIIGGATLQGFGVSGVNELFTLSGQTAVSSVIPFPVGFSLAQNYPNPFNPSTTIEYVLPNVGTRHDVSLQVFNLLGEEIRTVVHEAQTAGTHRIQFNAEGFPSGIYFYRIQAGSFTSSRKMLLLR